MGKYNIIWVEGLSLRNGEKISKFTDSGADYTTLLTEALRFKESDLHSVHAYLKRHGIHNYSVHNTSYAPKGTIHNSKRIAI
jgi:hypothetical protein